MTDSRAIYQEVILDHRRFTVFAGVRALPTHVKCAILPWHIPQAAFNLLASTSTEAQDDPMNAPVGGA